MGERSRIFGEDMTKIDYIAATGLLIFLLLCVFTPYSEALLHGFANGFSYGFIGSIR